MPCRDYGSDNNYNYRNQIRLGRTVAEQKDRLDMLARIACEAMTMLQSMVDPELKNVTKEAKEWFAKHQFSDQKEKKRREKLVEEKKEIAKQKKLALKKLTPEEIKALNLKV